MQPLLRPTGFRSERLSYRAVDWKVDEAVFKRFFSDPQVLLGSMGSVCRPLDKKGLEEFRKFVEELQNGMSAMVCLQPSADKPDEEGETIGWLGFTTGRYGGHHHRRGDFGLIMGSGHNGKGYATEAVEWLLEMAFVSFGLHRLEGDVYEWNAPALRVYEKCGFVIEGRRRQSMWQEGRFVDEFIIGMLQEDYRKAHPDKFERMR